jgi:hypothetical protein
VKRTAIVFGAGATKACNGPLTDEILPCAFGPFRERGLTPEWKAIFEREGMIDDVGKFLKDAFCIDVGKARREDFPSLPLLLSLIDTAIDRNEGLSGPNTTEVYDKSRLLGVRRSLEYLIFAVLQHSLSTAPIDNSYDKLLRLIYESTKQPPVVVSLNYDLLVDHAMMQLGSPEPNLPPAFPEFGCDIATDALQKRPRFGTLLKIHGSLDFLYCPGCQRLDVALSDDGRYLVKALNHLFEQQPNDKEELHNSYSCRGRPCHDCGANVQPIMITPTAFKDYRNAHVSRIWYEAHRQLRQADRVIFVGYSLPSDDVHVVYLLKRSLGRLAANMITVVECDKQKRGLSEHPVGRQYRTLFGDGIDWRTEGFTAWVNRLESEKVDVVEERFRS